MTVKETIDLLLDLLEDVEKHNLCNDHVEAIDFAIHVLNYYGGGYNK